MPRACLQAGVVADHFLGASRHDPEVEPAEALMILVMSTPATALRQDRPGVTRVQAHHRQLKGTQLVHQPGASGPLSSPTRSSRRGRQRPRDRLGRRRTAPAPGHQPPLIDDAHGGLGLRDIQSGKDGHGSSPLRGPAITPCLLRCLDCPVAIALLGTLYVGCECHQELDCRANPIRWNVLKLAGFRHHAPPLPSWSARNVSFSYERVALLFELSAHN